MEKLHFNVSSGLKNLIGKELITNKHIAIFELVKNSYDASASQVDIEFKDNKTNFRSIHITDDGDGMNYEELVNNWLFVAYSSKANLKSEIRTYAGAKGVGRFSCDRLGSKLTMYTKKKNENIIHKIIVLWGDFELNNLSKFEDINVQYDSFDDNGVFPKAKGTILEICETRDEWERKDILTLKKSLRRLVNPLNYSIKNPFSINMIASQELNEDNLKTDSKEIINGIIENDLFDNIFEKSVCIKVSINKKGNIITTSLYDRGEFIYEVKEENPYSLLKNISTKIYYLNQTAKISFHRIMGMKSVEYGSIFIYKNNFRVMKYGEPAIDFYGIDKRKSQGYNRYLGTRELVGYIEIKGENKAFKEATSRDGGFIENKSTAQLEEFYIKLIHRKLEKYVVDIIKFAQPLKSDPDTILTPDDTIEETIRYINKGKFISSTFNSNLLEILDARQKKSAVKQLDELSNTYRNNPEIHKQIEAVKRSTNELLRAKRDSDFELDRTEEKLEDLKSQITIEKDTNLFLRNTVDRKVRDVILLIHQIKIDSGLLRNDIVDCLKSLDNEDKLLKILAGSSRLAARIQANSRIIEKGNFGVSKRKIDEDLITFISKYLEQRYKGDTRLVFDTNKNIESMMHRFEPSVLMVIIDNIIDNSIKHNATNLLIDFNQDDEYYVIKFIDNGTGISEYVDIKRLGTLGYSTTNGSGIGLYNVRLLLRTLKGELAFESENGFTVAIRIKI